jgi:hypothetical protein
MSYDISLADPVTRETLELDAPHQMRGGTYAVGGTCDAHLNITYNYVGTFQELFGPKGIRFLYGKTGAWSLPHLKEGASLLGDDTSENYWDDTEGNVKQSILGLIALAELRPDGVWEGD